MNERIRELAKQAYETTQDEFQEDWDGTPRQVWDRKFQEKFAELLIRECAATAWWAEQYDMGDGKPISKQITEHFGVEE
jgi:hypothetical protein